MNDSNWKKLIDIVNALSTRYRRALSGAIASFAAFESINASATPAHVATWTAEEMLAQQKRADDVTAMDIYDIKLKQFPSRAEILLELTEKEIDSSGRKGHVAWLKMG
ncbi:hypothetical protein EI94DRAFT_1590631 [Lactarius quietus]|nr:hypothetical protein EI94DRAFT_1590631 [Lactarius quietus]